MTEPWRNVARDGMPPCDGETVFIGINTAGFACCFNEVTRDGVCSMTGPEISTVQMSGLRYWRALDRPDVAALSQPSAGTAGGAFRVTQEEREAVKEIVAGLAFICEISDTGALVDHAFNELERRRASPCTEGQRGSGQQEGSNDGR